MGNHDHGAALLGQLANHQQHLVDQFRLEGRGRLIEQHHLRVHGQGTGNRDPLLLPAGQALRVHMAFLQHADPRQQGLGLGLDLILVAFEDDAGAHHHVLQHRHMRPQIERLKNHGQTRTHPLDLPLKAPRTTAAQVRRQIQLLAMHAQLAAVGKLQQVHAAQQGAFA